MAILIFRVETITTMNNLNFQQGNNNKNYQGRAFSVSGSAPKKQKWLLCRFILWVAKNILVVLLVTVIAGLLVAYISFKQGWI